jgi:hypothetical protein
MHSDLRRDDGGGGDGENGANEPSFAREDRNGKLHFDDAADAAYRREKATKATDVIPAAIIYRPFDVTDDYGFATEAEMGLPAAALTGRAAGFTVHAPDSNAPMRIAAGYSVYAVKLDDDGDVMTGQLIGDRGLRIGEAVIVAEIAARRPERFAFDANFVIVNDGAGHTVEKFPVPRAAA